MKADFFDLEEEFKKLPACPGVYLMHNATDEIIYAGEAVAAFIKQYLRGHPLYPKGAFPPGGN